MCNTCETYSPPSVILLQHAVVGGGLARAQTHRLVISLRLAALWADGMPSPARQAVHLMVPTVTALLDAGGLRLHESTPRPMVRKNTSLPYSPHLLSENH